MNKIIFDKLKFIKKFELNTPSWDELLLNLDESYLNKEKTYDYTSIKYKSKDTFPGFFISYTAFKLLKVQSVLNKLNLKTAHLYLNILTQSPSLGLHKDPVNVWFWQVKGKTKWVIEEQYEYLLEEGDLIYLPKGTLHNVTPLGPRAGISMSYE